VMDLRKIICPSMASVLRLLLVASISAGIILLFTTSRGAHDSNWWKEVGFPSTAKPSWYFPDKPLASGADYFADYNVSELLYLQQQELALLEGDPIPAEPKFRYISHAKSPYPFFTLSTRPRVLFFPDFLSDEECEDLIQAARPSMSRSLVRPYKGRKNGSHVKDVRTSSQAWLQQSHEMVRPILSRIAGLTGFSTSAGEQLQILRYETGQKYDAHYDFFHPDHYGPQRYNRAVTCFLYLSDVLEGGETWFPLAGGKPENNDYQSCQGGLGVRPKKRALVIFYGMQPNGSFDLHSRHGGCPVKFGTKWAGTWWLRVATPA
jgi:prolyl 4-hydroxylase